MTMRTIATPDTAAKPSLKNKHKRALTAVKKKASKKPALVRPRSLEEARREMLRLVCLHSTAITQALIDDACEGKHLSAKFLFEAVGLCDVKGEDLEDASEQESLASMLLKQWHVPPQIESAAEGTEGFVQGTVTKVSAGAAAVALVTDAPVES